MTRELLGLIATILPVLGILLTVSLLAVARGRSRLVVATLVPAVTGVTAWLLIEPAFEVGHMLAVVIYIIFFLLLGIWFTGLFAWLAFRALRGVSS